MVHSAFPTIQQSLDAFIDSVHHSRSANTAKTYRDALAAFSAVLESRGLDPCEHLPAELPEESIIWAIQAMREAAPTTERNRLTAIAQFFEYLAAEDLAEVNLPQVRLLIRQRARRPGVRLPQFPREAIEKVLAKSNELALLPTDDHNQRLRNLRDRALLVTLADTGLRIHEACNLRRGDIDMREGRAVITGKGDRQAVVRFSTRSLRAIKDYLNARAELDGNTGRQLSALPVFARHDDGAGKKVKPMTTKTGRLIVDQRVKSLLAGEDEAEFADQITPHSFRHYFVTVVLKATGNLKLAQELARHRSIAVTQRYAHLSDDELDQGYYEIFER
ncbi:MAG TPA: tyrosine-type recombinase/integrase [Anaerolineaceae bacterium]|nr:tyrosine-type recombinase/integrase [Anaerolineaceae bacterium]